MIPIVLAALLTIPTALVIAQEANPEDGPTTRALAAREDARAWDELTRQKFGNDPAFLQRPYLLADKQRRTVTLKAIATGLRGTEPIEFFLIGPNSSKDYEAIASTLAKPSDIHAALVFLGLPPGRPVDFARQRFWPRGERVRITFHHDEPNPDGTVSRRSIRAEKLLIDRTSRQPLPESAFAFVGSITLPPEPGAPPDATRYFADLGDPGAVASNYNDATTVLDLPVQARQQEVYTTRVLNPESLYLPGQLLEITLELDSPPDQPRLLDLKVNLAGNADLAALRFLTDATPGLADSASAEQFIAAMNSLTRTREPFLTVTPAPEIPLATVRQAYALLQALETPAGIRLEPALPGHPFHQAFTPDERLRNWQDRLWQPTEIIFTTRDGRPLTLLRDFDEHPVAPEGQPRATPRDNPVTSPEQLTQLLAARAPDRRPIAVYAPPSMTYGQLLHWIGPSLNDESVVWIYLDL
jgi:hypothetical protein